MIAVPDKPKNKILGLDIMRVTAILLVLAAHSLWIYSGYNNLLTKGMNFSGFIGVEIFFVLSGFLIGSSLQRLFLKEEYTLKSARYFIKRRSWRILPNYLFVLCLNLFVAFLIGYSPPQPWKYFLFLQNLVTPMLPFFPESWSMSIKEVPYLVIPFVLLLLVKLGKSASRNRLFLLTALTIIAISLAAKIIYHWHHPHPNLIDWNISLRSVVLYRMDSVLMGVVASWIHFNYPVFWRKNKIILGGIGLVILLLLILLIGFIKVPIDEYPLFWNVIFLPVISVSAALFLPFFSEWKSASAKIEKPVQFLGGISYSVYLLHYSFVLYLMKYFIDTTQLNINELHIFTIAYLLITFILSFLMFTFFEKPIMKIRERKTQ